MFLQGVSIAFYHHHHHHHHHHHLFTKDASTQELM